MNQKINYRDAGSGDPVVLLHGFLGSLEVWNQFTDSLSMNYRVICIDLPGHGKTGCFADVHSMDFMAGTVKNVLDTLMIKKAVIIGHSMGGYVALSFANLYPGFLKGLSLFHSHAAADNEEAKMNRTRTIQIVEQDKAGFIGQFIPDLFAPENVEVYHEEIRQLKQIATNTPKEGIKASLKGMKDRKDHTRMLKKLEIPVMFIVGKRDKRIPAEIIMPQLALAAHTEALIIDHAGHMGFVEAHSKTLEFIKGFCARAHA
jgi:pimeloyl-ACP methyl ester carboxylesterase